MYYVDCCRCVIGNLNLQTYIQQTAQTNTRMGSDSACLSFAIVIKIHPHYSLTA